MAKAIWRGYVVADSDTLSLRYLGAIRRSVAVEW